MLKQTENKVHIEGILSEIDIEDGTFTDKKTNQERKVLKGSIKVKVNQIINGVDTDLEVPVYIFVTEFTNSGTKNPAYESVEKLKGYTSIAAGGIEKADYVRILNAQITMNEYYSQSGQLVSYPRIQASFFSKITANDCHPEATFALTFMVGSKGYVTDKDGVETDKYKVTAIVPQFGGKVDIVPLYTYNQNAIDSISNYWSEGDTVKIVGKLNFSSKTETHTVEVDFGEPTQQSRTISVSELLITGGAATPIDGEFAIDRAEVEAALAQRTQRLEALKAKGADRGTAGKAPSKSTSFKNLGF